MSTYKDKLESHHQSCLNDAGKLLFSTFIECAEFCFTWEIITRFRNNTSAMNMNMIMHISNSRCPNNFYCSIKIPSEKLCILLGFFV